MTHRTSAEESAHHYGTEREKSLAKDNADLLDQISGLQDEIEAANAEADLLKATLDGVVHEEMP